MTCRDDDDAIMRALIIRLRATVSLGATMREAQDRYFRSRSRDNLAEAKSAERIFDNAARALLSDPELSRLAGKPERHDV